MILYRTSFKRAPSQLTTQPFLTVSLLLPLSSHLYLSKQALRYNCTYLIPCVISLVSDKTKEKDEFDKR